jgi:Lipase (class 3)
VETVAETIFGSTAAALCHVGGRVLDGILKLVNLATTMDDFDWDEMVASFVERLAPDRASPRAALESLPFADLCAIAYLGYRSGLDAVQTALTDNERPLEGMRRLVASLDRPGRCRALAVRANDELVIAIRGSADINDWIYNVSVGLVGKPQLHSGFSQLTDEIWPWIAELVREKQREGLGRIVLTGHSLGGAVALLAAARMCTLSIDESPEIAAVIFGAPKVGSVEFRAGCSVKAFRMHGDLIPELRVAEAYGTHGEGYLLTGSVGIRPAPEAAATALLSWVKAAVATCRQGLLLRSAGTIVGDDLAALSLFAHHYTVACNPATTFGELMPQPFSNPLLLPAAVASFFRKPTTPYSSATISVGSKTLSRISIVQSIDALQELLDDPDAAMAESRAWPPNPYIQAVMLLALRRDHDINGYTKHLARASSHSKGPS